MTQPQHLLLVAWCILALQTPEQADAYPPPEASPYIWRERGDEAYKNKDYSQAIIAFQYGYNLSKDPLFLVDIVTCQQHLGQHLKAVATLNLLLTTDRATKEQKTGGQAQMNAFRVIIRTQMVVSASKKPSP